MASYKREANLQSKNYFLTFPQCQQAKELTLQNVKDMFQSRLKYAIVALEQHQDGTPHLHVMIGLNLRTRTTWSKLDTLTGKRGNYQITRRILDVMKYVTKDGDYVSTGVDVGQYLSLAKEKKSTAIALTIMEGKGLQELNQLDPTFVMMHLRKIKEYMAMIKMFQQKRNKLEHGTIQFYSSNQDPAILALKTWLNVNILHTRDFKQPQLFLHSVPNKGKTTLIQNMIKAGIRVYFLPYEDWYCDFENDCYDLIVLDEFKGQKKIQSLNQWTDGSHFPVKRKGIAPVIKTDNLPMIILSNYALGECYKVPYERLAPLRTRLTEIEVDEWIDIEILQVDSDEDMSLDDDDDD